MLITGNLVDVGVPEIWAKAISAEHKRILERLGATHVVLPESEAGVASPTRWAGGCSTTSRSRTASRSSRCVLRKETHNFRLDQLDLRSKYGVQVIGVKTPGEDFEYAGKDTVIHPDDLLVVAGDGRIARALRAASVVVSSLADGVRAGQFRLPRPAYGWAESSRLRSRRGRTAAPDIDAWLGAVPAARHRLLIAPANSAGQGAAWARAASAHLPDTAAVAWMFTTTGSYAFPADAVAPAAVSSLPDSWQHRLFDGVVATFTHVMIESGRPLFGGLFGHDAAREARALSDAGVTVAMAWHGTDIRLPSRERLSNVHSPFRDPGHRATTAMLEARASRNAKLAAASGVRQFFSTPDLGAHVPNGTWLPVVVDSAAWSVAPPTPHSGPLAVLFQPSQAWIKGVPLIEPVLDGLTSSGAITRVPSARVAPAAMPALVGLADVVLDQFRLDLYGVAAAEAMMASRPVVSLAGAPLREATLRLTGEELPVVSANAGEAADAVAELGADSDARAARGAAGHAFAKRWHDGQESARVLRATLGLG